MTNLYLFPTNLSLFAEGGDGSGTAATSGESTNTIPAAPAQGQSKKGEYANTYFGKLPEGANADQASAADSQAGDKPAENAPDKESLFRELVRGEYKDEYTKATQDLINKRFKETKAMEKQIADQQKVLDTMFTKYGISDGDLNKLQKSIDDDYNMWAEAADREGLTVETYKEMFKIRQQNAELMRTEQQRQQEARANAQMQQWLAEEQEVRKTFPNFDIRTEIQNPDFAKMLQSGVSVENAYRVMHMDDIVSNAMKTTASLTEKRVADSVKAKGVRPAENGTTAQSAFTLKDDVTKLNKADRAEVVKRALRGEIISF